MKTKTTVYYALGMTKTKPAVRNKASKGEIKFIRKMMGWDEFTTIGPQAIELFVAGRRYERAEWLKLMTDEASKVRM